MTFRRSIAWTSLLVILMLTRTAFAQPSDAALAAQLFIDGQKLMADGKAIEACPKLAESQRLDPKLGTLLNLASCHEGTGQLALAWSEFTDAVALAERAKRSDRIDFAKSHIAALEKKLARVRIVTPAETPEARLSKLEIRLDGKTLSSAALGSALPVDPGRHTVEATAPGKKGWSTSVDAVSGGESSVRVPLLEDEVSLPPPPKPAPPPRSEPPRGGSLRGMGFLVGGVGLAGLAVGSVFGVLAFTKEDDAKKSCPNAACATQEGIDGHDSARMSALVSTIAIAAGGVLTVSGAIMVLASPKSAASSASTTRTSVRLGPGSIVLGGTF